MDSWKVLVQVAAAVFLAGTAPAQSDGFALESAAFEEGAAIPTKYTAYGDNVSPPLFWKNAPEATRSFALILDDSDAPGPLPFIHWVLYNIPAGASELPEGVPKKLVLEGMGGMIQGPNGVRQVGYFGPRPPPGELHHYNFRLYALHSLPELPEGLDGQTLLDAIRPHILAETVLTGTYLAP